MTCLQSSSYCEASHSIRGAIIVGHRNKEVTAEHVRLAATQIFNTGEKYVRE